MPSDITRTTMDRKRKAGLRRRKQTAILFEGVAMRMALDWQEINLSRIVPIFTNDCRDGTEAAPFEFPCGAAGI